MDPVSAGLYSILWLSLADRLERRVGRLPSEGSQWRRRNADAKVVVERRAGRFGDVYGTYFMLGMSKM